jgi:CheY-like chemotaxis protein
MEENHKVIDILLVEDNPGDVRLTQEALQGGKLNNNLFVAVDGEDALAFLRQQGQYSDAPLPDLILLDLNLPKLNGHEVLAEIKKDDNLKHIPVVILTTSEDEQDIITSYTQYASSYIVKPVSLEKFIQVVARFKDYWLTVVKYAERD